MRKCGSIVHAAHAAHAAHASGAAHSGRILPRDIGDHGFSGDQERGDGAGILQGRSDHLGGIDDAGLDHVDVKLGLRVEALVGVLSVHQLADDDRALDAGVFGDLPKRSLKRSQHDRNARCHVGICPGQRG